MANQTVEIAGITTGQTLTAKSFAKGSDVVIDAALVGTELTNKKTHYRFVTAQLISGWHDFVVFDADGAIGTWEVNLTDTETVHYATPDLSLDDLALGAIASSVRTELAIELVRIDVAISTRLATDGYTAPDNVKIRKYLQLLARKDAAIATDNATELAELNANGGSGAGGFVNASESLEAIAAITAGDTTLVINADSPELDTIAADGQLTIHRGDWTTFDITLGSLTGRTGKKLVLTIKPKRDDLTDDSEAYLQVTEVDGAVLVNGSSDGVTASDASIVVINETTGQTRFTIKSAITNVLPTGSDFWYDVQMFDAFGEPRTKTMDRATVTKDVTRRTS